MTTLQEIWSYHPLVTLKEDRIGNLQVWQGERAGTLDASAYIQDSQNISAVLEHTNITPEEREELSKGYPVTLRMYDEQFCCLFGIEY